MFRILYFNYCPSHTNGSQEIMGKYVSRSPQNWLFLEGSTFFLITNYE